MNPSTAPSPGHAARGLWLGFALASVAIHLACITQYGYFRDEFYYLACARRLAWGYVDHPPLSIAVLALVRSLLGESLLAIRLVPVVVGALVVVLTGRLARDLGGGRLAQGLACLSALVAPVFLGASRTYSMNIFDLLLWTIAALVLVRILRDDRPSYWIVLGAVVGLGLLNKISMLWFGMGLFVGLVLTPQRRALLTPWPYLAALVAGLISLPHVLWQMANGWPTLEFMRNATGEKMAAVGVWDFLVRQWKQMGRGNVIVWVPGLAFALFARAGRPWRLLGWLFLTVAILLAAGGRSRASYLAVAYPMLVALGGVALERMFSTPRWARLRAVAVATLVLFTVPWLPFALPILPVETFVRYQAVMGVRPSTEELKAIGPVSQHYADMFGWEEIVAGVEAASRTLAPDERAHAVVFGRNYGEAGAVEVLGRRRGLPPAVSGHNNYWLWGPPADDTSVVIIIGGEAADYVDFFQSLELVGTTRDARYAMPYERRLPIFIGRGPRTTWKQSWPEVKHFD